LLVAISQRKLGKIDESNIANIFHITYMPKIKFEHATGITIEEIFIFYIIFQKQVFAIVCLKKIFFSFIHMCIHCLGHFSTLPPLPYIPPPQFQADPVLPLSLILLKK
jgi:hypothetical protein